MRREEVEIREEPASGLEEHGRIPIAFEVERVFDVRSCERGLAGLDLVERVLAAPYRKDYDALPANRPTDWPRRFDVSRWALLSAWVAGRRAGGAVVAWRTPGLFLLDGRSDLALLWDLRVAPELRGRGIGSALFDATERWAAARGCRQLKIETQSINVPACRFYARRGCELGSVRRFAYPELPEETQLLWLKDLAPAGTHAP
jgi:ribosomal protein S18 acetylase RimI-like enzyme